MTKDFYGRLIKEIGLLNYKVCIILKVVAKCSPPFKHTKINHVYRSLCSSLDFHFTSFKYVPNLKIFMSYAIGHQDSVSTVAFSSDGQLLASGSLDGVIQIWDITSGSLKCTLDGPGAGIEV